MNKTIRLYQQDVDLRSNDAAVVSLIYDRDEIAALGIKDKAVECLLILDQSVFFPEGGGQPSDLGTIDGYPVCHVREIGHTVYHQIDLAAIIFPQLHIQVLTSSQAAPSTAKSTGIVVLTTCSATAANTSCPVCSSGNTAVSTAASTWATTT